MPSNVVETKEITNEVRNHKETLHDCTFKLEREKVKVQFSPKYHLIGKGV